MQAKRSLHLMLRPHSLGEKENMEITFPIRSLYCVHYSQCLIQAVRQCLPTDRFSCAGCKRYEKEQIDDEDRVREGMKALRLLRAVWKDEKRSLQQPKAFHCDTQFPMRRLI